MRPASGSLWLLVLCSLLAARPAAGLRSGLLGAPADRLGAQLDEQQVADELGPAKVKRNVRTSEEMWMLFSDTGYALQILPNGAINTTTDRHNSPYGRCPASGLRRRTLAVPDTRGPR